MKLSMSAPIAYQRTQFSYIARESSSLHLFIIGDCSVTALDEKAAASGFLMRAWVVLSCAITTLFDPSGGGTYITGSFSNPGFSSISCESMKWRAQVPFQSSC